MEDTMRSLICLSLCSVLVASSAVAARLSSESQDQPSPVGDFDRYGVPNKGPPIVVPPRSDPRHPVFQPPYPGDAKAACQQGKVIVLLTVDTSGHVSKSEIKKSSGIVSLDQAAMKGASSWQLLPGTVNGKPTTMQNPFAMDFHIADLSCPVTK
jgi:protein TonB